MPALFTGFCVLMLWFRSILGSSEKTGGVFIFAVIAAGADLCAALGPQLLGVVTSGAIASSAVGNLATQL